MKSMPTDNIKSNNEAKAPRNFSCADSATKIGASTENAPPQNPKKGDYIIKPRA